MSDAADELKWGRPPTRASRFVYRTLHGAAALLFRSYFRVYLQRKHHFPAEGGVIVAPAGHRSNLDTPFMGAVSPRRLRYMAKDSLFKNKFWTWFLVTLGGFPVHRGSADREAMKAALAVLERGEPLVVFPEGARQEGPEVTEIFDGVAWLAARSGAPTLPIGIGGSERAMPIGKYLPRPRRVVFLTGELMPAPSNPDGKRVSRRQLSEFSAELRVELQALFDEAQDLAGTPNR